MQYSYQYDIAGIVILILTISCLFYQSRNIFYYGRFCMALIFDAFVFIVLDLISSILIASHNPAMFTPLYVCMIMYFLSLNMLPYFCMQFIREECADEPKRGLMLIVTMVLSVLLLIANYPFQLFFSIDPETLSYQTGRIQPLYMAYFAVFCIQIFYTVMKHRQYLGKLRRSVFLVVIIASLFDIVFMLIHPEINLTGFVIASCTAFTTIIFFLVDGVRDPLVKCNNRRGLRRACEELMAKHKGEELMYIRVEIHNLQEINERFGREIGDKVLITMANSLERQKDEQDMVFGRITGDTFAAMMCTNTYMSELSHFNLSQYVQEWILDQDYEISFYGGVCFFKQGELDLPAVMDRASYALNKIRGDFRKNVCIFNDKMEREYEQRKRLEQMARTAFKNDSFRVYLQPICDTMTKKLVSAEALVRWLDKDGSIIPPDDFVPIFEKNGFITQVDLFVLDEVCKTIRGWIDAGIEPIPVSVNVSRVDITSPHFVDKVIETVESYGLDHSLVKIELTESAFNDNMSSITEAMDRLRANHFKILMDDFGSGYSNLNMFQDVSVDIVKIDMKFLKNIDEEGKGRVILQAVVNMSRELGLETVVEGVENQTQFDFVKQLNCEMIQGYYFDRPMPIERFNEKMIA